MSKENIFLEKFISGETETIAHTKYFIPNNIHHQWIITDPIIHTLLERVYIKLGELNSYAQHPQLENFLNAHLTKEAISSTKLEGKEINFSTAFLPQEFLASKQTKDFQTLQNQLNAFKSAQQILEKKPLSVSLIRKIHSEIVKSSRIKKTATNTFRKQRGKSYHQSKLAPPNPTYILELMGDIEDFLLDEHIKVPYLIRIAIANYQLETIQPFSSGNNRLSNIITILYLLKKQILTTPLLLFSTTLLEKQSIYLENLNRAREKNDLYFWIRYFLNTLNESITQSLAVIQSNIKLKLEWTSTITEKWGRRSNAGLIFLEYLFQQPVVQVKDIENICNLSKKAANDLMKQFIKFGILKEISGQIRYRIFVFNSFIEIYEHKKSLDAE